MVGPLLADGFSRANLWVGFPLLLLALSMLLTLIAATVRLPPDAIGDSLNHRATRNPCLLYTSMFRDQHNIRVVLGEVMDVDLSLIHI